MTTVGLKISDEISNFFLTGELKENLTAAFETMFDDLYYLTRNFFWLTVISRPIYGQLPC